MMNCRSVSIALIGAVLLLSSPIRGQVMAGRTFAHERDIQTAFQWHELPRWDNGRLVLTDTHRSKGPIIFTFDSDGRDEQTLFTLKDAALITVLDVAASQDGELAVAGIGHQKSTPVSLTTGSPGWARILGFDGRALIMYSKNGEFQRYR